MTEGQAKLKEVVEQLGGVRRAADVISATSGRRLDHGSLGRWCRGNGSPGREWQELLVRWVPLAAWSRSAGAPQGDAGAPAPPRAPDVAPRPGGRSIAELQERLRAIPGELAALGAEVASGAVSLVSAEPRRRLLEGEARALKAAIDAAGVATVGEVEQLRALMREVTKGCDGCRARLLDALRALGSGS